MFLEVRISLIITVLYTICLYGNDLILVQYEDVTRLDLKQDVSEYTFPASPTCDGVAFWSG